MLEQVPARRGEKHRVSTSDRFDGDDATMVVNRQPQR